MKFKPSIAFDEFSGSAGNVTAANVKGRSYIKRKPIPFNPNTEKQQEVRNRFKLIAKAYKALAQDKKTAWEEKSKSALSRAVFGVKATLSGINLFQQVNQNLAIINAPLLNAPSNTPAEFPTLSLINVDGNSSGTSEFAGDFGSTSGLATLVFEKFVLPENVAIVIRMSDMIETNTKFLKSKTKIVSTSPQLLQLAGSDEKNNLKKDVTLIPLGQTWVDAYKRRAPSDEPVMISVELVSKVDGSMISVLQYCGNPYGKGILNIMIDSEGAITAS